MIILTCFVQLYDFYNLYLRNKIHFISSSQFVASILVQLPFTLNITTTTTNCH
jgi:hypothetical protein